VNKRCGLATFNSAVNQGIKYVHEKRIIFKLAFADSLSPACVLLRPRPNLLAKFEQNRDLKAVSNLLAKWAVMYSKFSKINRHC